MELKVKICTYPFPSPPTGNATRTCSRCRSEEFTKDCASLIVLVYLGMNNGFRILNNFGAYFSKFLVCNGMFWKYLPAEETRYSNVTLINYIQLLFFGLCFVCIMLLYILDQAMIALINSCKNGVLGKRAVTMVKGGGGYHPQLLMG